MTFSPCSDSQPGKLADCSSTSLSIHHCPVPMHPAELPSSPYPSLHIHPIHLKPQTPSSKLPRFPVWVFANRKGSLIAPAPTSKRTPARKLLPVWGFPIALPFTTPGPQTNFTPCLCSWNSPAKTSLTWPTRFWVIQPCAPSSYTIYDTLFSSQSPAPCISAQCSFLPQILCRCYSLHLIHCPIPCELSSLRSTLLISKYHFLGESSSTFS